MRYLGLCCGLIVVLVVGFMLRQSLRFKGRKVHFRCESCGATETHFERRLDVRSVLNPTCRCGGTQRFTVEGNDLTGDIETFGRNPAEAGSLVICSCGAKSVVPGECDIISYSADGQVPFHQRPVACPRCGTQYSMVRPSGSSAGEQAIEGCNCGVAPVPLTRGMALRCTQCQKRTARITLMS